MTSPRTKKGDRDKAALEETRQRARRLDALLDLIPARYYLGSEGREVLKGAQSLDPELSKSTSQLVVEAARATGSSQESSSSRRGRAQKKQAGQDRSKLAKSRAELHMKLEQRIAELREERRARQSATDKAKGKPQAQAQSKPPHKINGSDGDVDDDDVEVGHTSYAPKQSDMPFEVTVNPKGTKMKKMQAAVRQSEAAARRLAEAEAQGTAKELRQDMAMRKALKRVAGEKVMDNVSKLRKSVKAIEMDKKKRKEKWGTRVEQEKTQIEERVAQRKENLANRRSGKRKNKGRTRVGFEGKRGGSFMNSDS